MKKTLKRTLTLLLTVVCVASSLGTQTVEAKDYYTVVSSKKITNYLIKNFYISNDEIFDVDYYYYEGLSVNTDTYLHFLNGYSLPKNVTMVWYRDDIIFGEETIVKKITYKDIDKKGNLSSFKNLGITTDKYYFINKKGKVVYPDVRFQVLPVDKKKFYAKLRKELTRNKETLKCFDIKHCENIQDFATIAYWGKASGHKTYTIQYSRSDREVANNYYYKTLPTTYNSDKGLKLPKIKAKKGYKFVGWKIDYANYGGRSVNTKYVSNILKGNKIDKGTYGDLVLKPVFEKK